VLKKNTAVFLRSVKSINDIFGILKMCSECMTLGSGAHPDQVPGDGSRNHSLVEAKLLMPDIDKKLSSNKIDSL